MWRRVWLALATAQSSVGLVNAEQLDELRERLDDVDITRAHEIESEIRHDLMAELRVYAEQCPEAGKILHLGATSMDIVDNADALRMRDSLGLILTSLRDLLAAFAQQIETWAGTPTMAFTHLQPAEPTTIGYRLAQYAQELLIDWSDLRRLWADLRGKGFKGAVGTSAAYAQLLEGTTTTPETLSSRAMAALNLEAWPVATQVYTRKQDLRILNALAGVAQTLYKFAFDLRLLQNPTLGEWSEPFGAHQVGSSAMPFKRNPIRAERLCSLARMLAALPRVAWDDAAHTLLERTLDDSANRRIILPQACLLCDELLTLGSGLVTGLNVDLGAVKKIMDAYGPFAATERVLMEATKAGGDRQALHEVIRGHSLAGWKALQENKPNTLLDDLKKDPALTALLSPERIEQLMDATGHIGDAPIRSRSLAATIREAIDPA